VARHDIEALPGAARAQDAAAVELEQRAREGSAWGEGAERARSVGRSRPRARRWWRKASEVSRDAKRRHTAGRGEREARGTRARHSRRSSSGREEIGDPSVAGWVELRLLEEAGTGTAVWRAGSAGMQDLASQERLREWQLSPAMSRQIRSSELSVSELDPVLRLLQLQWPQVGLTLWVQ
jgi:hypothetical protein